MYELIEKDDSGNWCLKGVPWRNLRVGELITDDLSEKLYGALWKLMRYESTGYSPEDLEELR